MRKTAPMIIAIVSGLVLLFSRYVYWGGVWRVDITWDRWFLISTALAAGLGVLNLSRIHVKNLMRRRNLLPSSVLLISLWGYSVLGLALTVGSGPARWIYEAFNLQLVNALFSMLAFFIFSAAYRAFRIKSIEASLMMVAAIITMLGTAPLGGALIPGIEGAKDWLLNVPVTGSYRGILIGAYLGSFATAMRILLGLERAHLSGGGS